MKTMINLRKKERTAFRPLTYLSVPGQPDLILDFSGSIGGGKTQMAKYVRIVEEEGELPTILNEKIGCSAKLDTLYPIGLDGKKMSSNPKSVTAIVLQLFSHTEATKLHKARATEYNRF